MEIIRLSENDATLLYDFLHQQDEEYMKFFGSRKTLDNYKEDLKHHIICGLFLNNIIIGICGLGYKTIYPVRQFNNKYWLYFVIDSKCKGQGFGQTFINLFIQYVHEITKIKEIYCGVYNDNYPSLALLNKLRFKAIYGNKRVTVLVKNIRN